MRVDNSDWADALQNKVPVVALVFWVIKILSTTVGETGADFLIFKLHFGLPLTSLIMGALLVVSGISLVIRAISS